MVLSLYCLGASGEVGRSAFLLHTDKRIMLDYGVKLFGEGGKPEYPLAAEAKPELAVITHAHLDHSGFVPALYKTTRHGAQDSKHGTQNTRLRWYATPPTMDIGEVLWRDNMKIMGEELPYRASHFKKAMKYWHPVHYGQVVHAGETRISMADAGHICGAGIVLLEHAGKRICYTGDFKVEETRIHTGAEYVEDVDVLIIEATYAQREHPPRAELEAQFIAEIRETIEIGGSVLLPAFAVGRTQELLVMLRQYIRDVPLFVDGMGRTVTKTYLKHGHYIKDAAQLKKAVASARFIREAWERKEAAKQPSIIITSAGMMNGGPVLEHLQRLAPQSRVILTGYSLEGTNAWKLLNEGCVTINGNDFDVSLAVSYLDFSAHAGRHDLLNFIKHANPEKIVLVHGDETKKFEAELKDDFGYDAIAPVLGEKINLSG